ncbi:MAG: peptide chain release factor 1 [candidate division KSB1 bacterium]|nr:peptide chain release factor 1 [candidate division KSB1 bacterium]
MVDKLEKIEKRYQELSELLSDPRIISDVKRYRSLAKEQSDLSEIVEKFRDYKKVLKDIDQDEEVLRESHDKELKELAQLELDELREKKEALEEELKLLLVPRDPQDAKNAVMEIRAGTGGEEAGLFAGDLYRMYVRFAERRGWKTEVLSSHPQGIGGFKEIIFAITGNDVYGKLKYESGVHRVQRVPVTEASGRIHTSAASVVVLPEAEEVDVEIKPEDLRIDVFRSSGPGGQSVNTTDSAVRITHLPTGMVVTCQDEKSQHKNKAKALKVLRARLYEKARREEEAKIVASRRSMISTGDRSAKIRTFNFPQNRVTDHRIGLTLYKLDDILDGDLEELIEQLQLADRDEQLRKAS